MQRALSAGTLTIGIGNDGPLDCTIDFSKVIQLRKAISPSALRIIGSEAQAPEDLAALSSIETD